MFLLSRRRVAFFGFESPTGTSIASSRVQTPTSTCTSSPKGRKRFGELCCFETDCGRTRPTANSTLAPNGAWRRKWKYVQNYADAKSEVVKAILERAEASGG